MIKVRSLNKNFRVHKKEPGLLGSLKALFKREFFNKPALKDINLSVNQGEIIGLIGSNGAGKTTLTKILSGIIHPSSGEVSVNGHNPWRKNNDFRKQISVIMGQKAQLWWDLPALDGFLLLKEIYQIPEDKYQQNLKYLSDCLDIHDQLKIQVRKLSLGERMKVELMAALLHDPKVVLLDEPTIGLDLTAQKAIRQFIRDYRKKHNPIMILTSHYMDDIEELCERVVILKQGEKIFDGQLSDINQKYNDKKLIKAKPKHSNPISNDLKQICQINSWDEHKIELAVKESDLSKATQVLLQNHQVYDLKIEALDLSYVIESILSGKNK